MISFAFSGLMYFATFLLVKNFLRPSVIFVINLGGIESAAFAAVSTASPPPFLISLFPKFLSPLPTLSPAFLIALT